MKKLQIVIIASVFLALQSFPQSGFPSKVCAPYLECWGNASPSTMASSTGNKFYTLAFIISNGTSPYWDGTMPLSTDKYVTDITSLRAQGGDVIISFGGQSGIELALSCGSVSALQAAYQEVITKYNLKWMDLDIEGAAVADVASITRRNQALGNLQTANPGLRVSYTLPVMPDGLDQYGQDLLANAKSNGVEVDIVNVMAMDYGSCGLDMGQAAIAAASSTKSQLATLGIAAKIGITPMLGVNDVSCENFTTANAQTVLNYANANSYIGLLAFWAVGRDANNSYLNILKAFNAPTPAISIPASASRTISAGLKSKTFDVLGRLYASPTNRFSVEKTIVSKGCASVVKIK